MAIDWTNLYKEYKGQWVALEQDERTVVSFGESAREAWEKATARGHANPILSRVPEDLVTYIGFGV